ncbi:venom allergen 5 [Lepeophtheirus salmonis]|uniref:venom allergen 5 n=1 Tax=Lepeophtheirus salmonis TaxID=72036 RepID=UPI003AF35085
MLRGIYFTVCFIVCIKEAFSECQTLSGNRCLTKNDPGAAEYFNYFGWKSSCFDYNGGKYCMISIGNLRPCKCTNGGSGGGGNDGSNGGTVGQGGSDNGSDNLKCDSSTVENFGECSGLKQAFCPLTFFKSGVTHRNTLCKYCGEDKQTCSSKICTYDITSEEDKQRIVDKHNDLRSNVALGNEKKGIGGPQPSAANMNRLKWDSDLAKSAQMWTLQCQRGHDNNRLTPQFDVWVGQNIASSWNSVKTSSRYYETMIQGWYNEVKDFPSKNVEKYSSEGATGQVGHYTALVWAATTRVGCGFIMYYDDTMPLYPYKKMLVCNYGVGGNLFGEAVYKIGKPGSDCPNGHRDGLCN